MFKLFTWKDHDVCIPVVASTHDILDLEVKGPVSQDTLRKMCLEKRMWAIAMAPYRDGWALWEFEQGIASLFDYGSYQALMFPYVERCRKRGLFTEMTKDRLREWLYQLVYVAGEKEKGCSD